MQNCSIVSVPNQFDRDSLLLLDAVTSGCLPSIATRLSIVPTILIVDSLAFHPFWGILQLLDLLFEELAKELAKLI